MKKLLDNITAEVTKAFVEAGYEEKFGKVTLSNRPDLCEFQCNGAMAAAKQYKKAPFMIADDVAARLQGQEMFASVESVKPGFLNLKLSEEYLAEYLREMQADERYGCEKTAEPKTIMGAGEEAGIRRIIEGLNTVLTADTPVNIALETMAGKGSEIGRNFEELAAIYEGVRYNDKLRVCFDTCHVHDAGYDIVHDFSGVMSQFDKVIGQDQIAVFHVNDSKNPCGAHKDRHENFGFGEIGFEALMQVVNCPDFEQIPKILETPYIPDAENKKKSYAPYKF